MQHAEIEWIPMGTRFAPSDMAFYQAKGKRKLTDVLGEIDLVVTGPHATAAFPEELQPFVDPGLTTRLQHDFCDISTAPIARRWAELDPRVLYIEDPHPRAVRDANRARPIDVQASLRAAFDRLAADPGGHPSLAGVDAIRPVTFSYLPVLSRPTSDAGWNALTGTLEAAGMVGVDAYERTRDDLLEQVLEAKLRRLAALNPATTSRIDWTSATCLLTLSIHDTMNHTARPDGAICLERPEADRLPSVVALSNRGDAHGELRSAAEPSQRDPIDAPTMEPALLRSIAAAYRISFGAHYPGDVAFNHPYTGGYETQVLGPRLRELAPLAVVRTDERPARAIRMGAWQNEFRREFLLGPEATTAMMQPGTDWPSAPPDRVDWIARGLTEAHDLVRTWWTELHARS